MTDRLIVVFLGIAASGVVVATGLLIIKLVLAVIKRVWGKEIDPILTLIVVSPIIAVGVFFTINPEWLRAIPIIGGFGMILYMGYPPSRI